MPDLATTALTQPKNLDELKLLLDAYGVDYSLWGQDAYKSSEQLLAECQAGESVLAVANMELVRSVIVVGVTIRYQGLTLFEAEQRFHSGAVRKRNLSTSIAEKMLPNEKPVDAAKRAITEELDLDAQPLSFTLLGQRQKKRGSTSYPGLAANYRFFDFACYLPDEAFAPDGYQEHQPDKTTVFRWREN